MALLYKVSAVTWSPVTPPAALASSGGAWVTLNAHMELRQGALDYANDGKMFFRFSVYTYSPTSTQFRLYDVDNARTAFSVTAFNTIASPHTSQSVGPLGGTIMPGGDARWRLEYNGGGASNTWHGVVLDISRIA